MKLFVAFLVSVLIIQCSSLYSPKSPVQVFDRAAFQSKVRNGEGVWLVEFFANWCGHCKMFAPEYEKAASALKGIVKVVAVEDESVMGVEGVTGFPTIKLYIGGDTQPIDFKGDRKADQVVRFVMQELGQLANRRLGRGTQTSGSKKSSGSSDVIELTDSNFDAMVQSDTKNSWFIEFYAPWCGHCKALAPTWEEVGTALKGKVKVAKVDATVNTALAGRFGVRGFPTLKLFPSGEKSDKLIVPYDGPRDTNSLIEFASGFVGDLSAEQLVSNSQFEAECSKGVCVIAFLPHILDSAAKGREKYLKELNGVVKASATMPVKFFWCQGGDNFELEESLRLQFGWPAVIAMRLDKQKYAIHKGDFSRDSIKLFLTGLMSGRTALSPIPTNLPKWSEVAKWDGKDAPTEEPVIDDEL